MAREPRPPPGARRVPETLDNRVDAAFGPPEGGGIRWRHPLRPDDASAGPWMFLPLPEFAVDAGDIHWPWHESRDLRELDDAYARRRGELGRATGDADAFERLCREEGRDIATEALLFPDPAAMFEERREAGAHEVTRLDDGALRIDPPASGDVELHLDLGDQICGFLRFECAAAPGTVIDVAAVEHVREDGVIQHTEDCRNGCRYIAGGDRDAFFSMQRRSGRHWFLTLRNMSGPVVLRGLDILESRYPAECPRPFACDDAALNRIWNAAHRTMQLSMDDVYIDSLYEQTLWVGDARNEQRYGLAAYDARDISLRSIRLAADSLERMPMINCQAPSCWETIIPVWSFLWVISVWEYFEYTGDRAILRAHWPDIRRNLRGAAAQLNGEGLFEAPWWGLFEWAHVDREHRVVLYNSLFFAGAADAALKCEAYLDDPDERDWLRTLRERLLGAVRRRRDPETGLYPESIHADGSTSPRFSIHTQFLAVLYGAATGDEARALLDRVEHNAGELVELASPFALQFYAEAFEHAGRDAHAIAAMKRCFEPMTAIGTTLWEALPGSATSPDGFPTRSHCHGWSSCAMDFFPRILLGLRMEGVGSEYFVCSPRPHGLGRAEGCRQTPFGPVEVAWRIEDGVCRVAVRHPPECAVRFASNPLLEEAGIRLEGETTSR